MNRKFIYSLKFIAIMSVLSAHTSSVGNSSEIIVKKVSIFLEIIGIFGVPIFFLISGYLFGHSKSNFVSFFKKKFFVIVIPWVIIQSLLWLFIVLRHGNFTFYNWIFFIVGYGHSTYYLTVLLIFYFVFWKTNSSKTIIKLIIFSYIFLILNALNYFEFLNLDPYLNPLAWSSYFLIGYLVKLKDLNILRLIPSKKSSYYLLFSTLMIIFLLVISDIVIYYWSFLSILLIPTFIISILRPVYNLAYYESYITNIISKIGNLSFTIYLTHEFFAGFIVFIFTYFELGILNIFRPITLLMIVYLLILFSTKFLSRFKYTKSLLNIIGIRNFLI